MLQWFAGNGAEAVPLPEVWLELHSVGSVVTEVRGEGKQRKDWGESL